MIKTSVEEQRNWGIRATWSNGKPIEEKAVSLLFQLRDILVHSFIQAGMIPSEAFSQVAFSTDFTDRLVILSGGGLQQEVSIGFEEVNSEEFQSAVEQLLEIERDVFRTAQRIPVSYHNYSNRNLIGETSCVRATEASKALPKTWEEVEKKIPDMLVSLNQKERGEADLALRKIRYNYLQVRKSIQAAIQSREEEMKGQIPPQHKQQLEGQIRLLREELKKIEEVDFYPIVVASIWMGVAKTRGTEEALKGAKESVLQNLQSNLPPVEPPPKKKWFWQKDPLPVAPQLSSKDHEYASDIADLILQRRVEYIGHCKGGNKRPKKEGNFDWLVRASCGVPIVTIQEGVWLREWSAQMREEIGARFSEIDKGASQLIESTELKKVADLPPALTENQKRPLEEKQREQIAAAYKQEMEKIESMPLVEVVRPLELEPVSPRFSWKRGLLKLAAVGGAALALYQLGLLHKAGEYISNPEVSGPAILAAVSVIAPGIYSGNMWGSIRGMIPLEGILSGISLAAVAGTVRCLAGAGPFAKMGRAIGQNPGAAMGAVLIAPAIAEKLAHYVKPGGKWNKKRLFAVLALAGGAGYFAYQAATGSGGELSHLVPYIGPALEGLVSKVGGVAISTFNWGWNHYNWSGFISGAAAGVVATVSRSREAGIVSAGIQALSTVAKISRLKDIVPMESIKNAAVGVAKRWLPLSHLFN